MPKKRSNPDHDTPTKSTEKWTKEKQDSICPVCDTIIVEGVNGATGDEQSTAKVLVQRGCTENV